MLSFGFVPSKIENLESDILHPLSFIWETFAIIIPISNIVLLFYIFQLKIEILSDKLILDRDVDDRRFLLNNLLKLFLDFGIS